MPNEASKVTPLRFTLTGAGIAAIIASILPAISFFRGEPTAEKVASRSDQENKRLFRNQRKLYGRMALAEAKLEFFEKMCVRYGARVVEAVKSPPALPKLTRPTRPPTKCRRGYVRYGAKCLKAKTVLRKTIAALKDETKAKNSALKKVNAAVVAKKRAEYTVRTTRKAAQQLAPPAPLLKKE